MTITFELPVASLVSPNKTLRMLRTDPSWRGRMRKNLAWEVVAAIGRRRPAAPIGRAKIVVERYAPRPLDDDNLAAACKGLFDVLQPFSKRHPNGLGVIASDAPGALSTVFKQIQCPGKEARVIVTIQAAEEAAAA